MKISVPTKNGVLEDQYSKHAAAEYRHGRSPVRSFPVSFEDVPNGTESLALVFVDFDSIPVCGFAWIHWLAANIPADTATLPENASAENALNMVQGANSCISRFVGETDKNIVYRYVGPTPPDQDHKYTLTAYALDCTLDLKEGYYLNEFLEKIKGHVLDKASVELIGRK
ncbi:MAG: YbhB/YbcL family Raf kinase inhibitor-like protein [Oscillospiraceae bacterium]|nr:YbhB/YbcL family Raf kinase inhibitor-like protein [Oscillospiraceae bacterium]